MSSGLIQSHKILFINTLAFTVCFACWTINGVLVTYLVDKGIFDFTVVETGWLLGIPMLTGSVLRLPAGILTDKYGGKYVFAYMLLFCSIPLFLLPFATSFFAFALLSFLFGMVGTGFAIGIGFTSVWYPKTWQGRALGIFGMGNAGAAFTTFFAPSLLQYFTAKDPVNGWKLLPVAYGILLIIMGILFILFTKNKKNTTTVTSLKTQLSPLRKARVWRFGLYYLLVFGFFVAYAQWLVPNFMHVYGISLMLAGVFASFFSLPSGVIRAFGGYLSDKFGARIVMYWVLGTSIAISFLLIFPKMSIYTDGQGVLATHAGIVTEITSHSLTIGDKKYVIKEKYPDRYAENKVLPVKYSWQEVVVRENQIVQKKELLIKGITEIKFSANMWVYLILVTLIGISWGIGKAAVYKHIPEYFPHQVGVVGGMVGLIGGLGGFIGPILFGYLLDYTGLWTSSWIFIFLLSVICLIYMNRVIAKMTKEKMPDSYRDIENRSLK